MTQSVRQSELFAGEEWRVLYRAFTTINFNASDPPTIAKAMREYLQANYPEDYNDWIESSEFMFLLELIAWLGGNLAYKTDINARENFMEVAEARESILRLARFLSYNPRRNQPARGLVKIVELETDDDIEDSLGINLNRTFVQWDNPDDPLWMERFVLLMNNAFVQNNQFGQPLKSGHVGNIRTQLYRMNNRFNTLTPAFTATSNGERMNFELCNGDFDDNGAFFERTPDLDGAFHLFYRADGNGNASTGTGFFMFFKQGELRRQTFSLAIPAENQLIDLPDGGINDSDVWVQTVSDSGTVIRDWQKVPALIGENTTFSSFATTERNIYQAVTRDDDRVTLRFSDGRFGNVPVGNIRVWYRTSNGQRYQIRPQEINRVRVPMSFVNRRGVTKTLYVTFSLQESVTNSTPRETDEQVRRRAPQVYATQNRMVSGEDYNVFPLQSNAATKLKAVNRVYAGHSRYIDLADPTGNYQDTNVFSDDGLFYRESDDQYVETPIGTTRSAAEIISRYIQPMLNRQEVANYVWNILLTKEQLPAENEVWTWNQSTAARFSATGWISNAYGHRHFREGSILEIVQGGVKSWVSIHELSGDAHVAPVAGLRGPVTLSEPIETGTIITRVIPRWSPALPPELVVSTSLFRGLEQVVRDGGTFTLWYNWDKDSNQWEIRPGLLAGTPEQTGTRIRVLSADYFNGMWRITAKGTRFVFESEVNVRWYFDGARAVDSLTGIQKEDMIRVMSSNDDLNDRDGNSILTGRGLRKSFDLGLSKVIRYPDGFAEPRRIGVKFMDSDEDGQPDNPDTFLRIAAATTGAGRENAYLFWTRIADGSFVPARGLVTAYEMAADRVAALANHAVGEVVFQLKATAGAADQESFWVVKASGNSKVWERDYANYRWAVGRGGNTAKRWHPNGADPIVPIASPLNFQWKHYAPSDHRIDPSKTNIIDIFVLTSEYDFRTRQWVADGGNMDELPLPPSELDLRIAFNEFNQYKMFSDEIVWRPVQYKFLFGEGADEELRAQFKVVKLASSPLSDGEIKSRVVRAINEFFNVELWEFGDTFYYTELAAFVHQRLAGVIGSIVLVPMNEDSSFGQGFEVRCRSDELFLSTAQVDDVVIISSNTAANLRIR